MNVQILLIFLFNLVAVFLLPNFGLNKKVTNIKIHRFLGDCPKHHKPVSHDFGKKGPVWDSTRVYLNFTVTVDRKILPPISMHLYITRCKNKENLDTCENFFQFKTTKFCDMIDTNSDVWQSYVNAIHPKMKCPLTPGVYTATNATVDLQAFLLFPVETWFWRVKMYTYEKVNNSQELTGCIFGDATIYVK